MKLSKEKKYTILWLFFFAVNIIIIAAIAYREFHGKEHSTGPMLTKRGILYLSCGLFCLLVIFLTETVKCRLIMRGLGERITWRAAFETADADWWRGTAVSDLLAYGKRIQGKNRFRHACNIFYYPADCFYFTDTSDISDLP